MGRAAHDRKQPPANYRNLTRDVSVSTTDNDSLTVTLSPAAIDESGSNNVSTVTASLNIASSVTTTVTVSATPTAPATTSDYTLSGTTRTVAAGATTSSGTVTLTAVDNTLRAANNTVREGTTNADTYTVALAVAPSGPVRVDIPRQPGERDAGAADVQHHELGARRGRSRRARRTTPTGWGRR